MLIGICGRKGAGKSTLAALIPGQRLAFADPLKRMLMALGLTEEQLWGSEKEVPCELLGWRTPRYAMQTLGTDWGRNLISPSLWERLWMTEAQKILDNGFDIVVEDVRFKNEVDAIRALDGIVVGVHRPGVGATDSHSSEALDFEALGIPMIVNDGKPTDMLRHLHRLLR
jgi:hypothetical protein